MSNKTPLSIVSNQFTKNLILQGATYASIIIRPNSTNQKLFYHSTSEEWDNQYHYSNKSNSCHLIFAVKQMSKKSKSFDLIWDLHQPINEVSQNLNEMRLKFGLFHGISLCQVTEQGYTQIITLTGRKSDFLFPKTVLENKRKILEEFTLIKTLHNSLNDSILN